MAKFRLCFNAGPLVATLLTCCLGRGPADIFKVSDAGLSGGEKTIVYTVIAGDTLGTIATNLAAAVTADADMQAVGVSACALSSPTAPSSIGSQIVFRSVSNNITQFNRSTSAGATETIDMSVMFNGTENARLGGTITTGDVLTITVKDVALAGGQQAVSYTVLPSDTFKLIAQGLAAAINANTNLQGIGVSAISNQRVVSITSLSLNDTSYAKSLSAGATETIALSTNLNGTQTALIGGTITASDVLTLTIFDSGLSTASQTVSYTVLPTDTTQTIATALAAAINANNPLKNEGISASSVGSLVNIKSVSTNITTVAQSTNGGATETIALSRSSNVTKYDHNNVNELTAIDPGGATFFRGTTNKAVKSASINAVPATLNTSRDFSGNAVLNQGANNVAVTAVDGGNNSKTENMQVSVKSPASASLSYDANGNMTGDGTNSYVWDADNRLIQINYPGMNNFSSFTFDAMGRNVKTVEVSGGSTTSTKQFVWSGLRRCEIRDQSSAVVSLLFVKGEQTSGSNRFYTQDKLGSVREFTDNSGVVQAQYQYDLFGQRSLLVGSAASSIQYAGLFYHEPSALNLACFRQYNAPLGRWISRDPIGEKVGPNLYAYVGNMPVNLSDPSGLDSESCCCIDWDKVRDAANLGTAMGMAVGGYSGGTGGFMLGLAGGGVLAVPAGAGGAAVGAAAGGVVGGLSLGGLNLTAQMINLMMAAPSSSDDSGGFQKNPQGDNTKKNAQAEAALKEACRKTGTKFTKELQRDFHDLISGQGLASYKDLLKKALELCGGE